MNFGPLNREGGERRLNVAITRARSEMIVFSSLSSDDIDLSRTSSIGVLDFKHFLDYADRGVKAIGEAIFGSRGDFDSPFEVAVARGLRKRGWNVHPQIGVSAFRIDLGIVSPDKAGKYLVGIECDGATYHRSATARDRDKVREEILTKLGWKILRLWSTDFWINSEKELDRLSDQIKIELDKEKELDQKKKAKNEETAKDSSVHESDVVDKMDLRSVENHNSEILRYFNLRQDGTYSCNSTKIIESEHSLLIHESERNGYLIQGYDNGHINKVLISTLLLKTIDQIYMNGANRDATLIFLEIVPFDNIIGLWFDDNGNLSFKAHLMSNISNREQLQLQGIKVMPHKNNGIKYGIIPITLFEKIEKLVFASFGARGKKLSNKYYRNEWIVLEKYNPFNLEKKSIDESSSVEGIEEIISINENDERSEILNKERSDLEGNELSEYNAPDLFNQVKVKLNNVVTVKYLNDNKIVKVIPIEEKPSQKDSDIIYINVRSALGVAIMGKNVGDTFSMGEADHLVEILEINS